MLPFDADYIVRSLAAGFSFRHNEFLYMASLLDNPLINKELLSRLRSRKVTPLNRFMGIFSIAVLILSLYAFVLYTVLISQKDFPERADILLGILILGIQLPLLILIAPSAASGSITMEREQQTWNALLLSRLSSREIVTGKLLSSLIPVLLFLILFLPLNLICFFLSYFSTSSPLPPSAAFLMQLVLFATAFFYVTLSLYASWRVRRTFQASSAALSAIIMQVIGTFILFGLWSAATGISRADDGFNLLWFNPFFVMSQLSSHDSLEDTRGIYEAIFYLIYTTALSFFMLWHMTRRLSRGPRELEQ